MVGVSGDRSQHDVVDVQVHRDRHDVAGRADGHDRTPDHGPGEDHCVELGQCDPSGELRVDPELARRVALAQLDAMVLPGTVVGSPVVTVSAAGDVVTIAVDLDIDHVMLRAVPGHPDHQQIHVAASARLNR